MIVLIFAFCFLGPHIWQTDQVHTDIAHATLPPSWEHPLGTDDVGYDVLGRLMVGGQTSLEVALGAAAVAVVLGVLWGAVAGFLGGVVDSVMMRIVDAILAIPALFLLLFVAQRDDAERRHADRGRGADRMARARTPRPRRDAQPADARVRRGRHA